MATNSSNVIKFERIKDVSGWSLNRIRDYMIENKWRGFTLHWRDGDNVKIERTIDHRGSN